MFRVGQRILTSSLVEGRVTSIQENGSLRVLFSDGVKTISPDKVFSIIFGPTEPETEDVGYMTLSIENDSDAPSKHRNFDEGDVISWVHFVGGASIEIKGCVLSQKGKFLIASEWGASVPQRKWVLPINKVWKSSPF